MTKVFLQVMAGGSGTRFWPRSTSSHPKQLLELGAQGSLLRQTLARFEGIVAREQTWILTTGALEAAVRKDVGEGPRILAEPQARTTAPCLFWAAKEAEKIDPNSVLLVMPSDHLIGDVVKFRASVEQAIEWASRRPELVTLGIRPTRPETGYGYLELGEPKSEECVELRRFVEKPDLKRAKEFVDSGRYLWNGGMFIWKTSEILRAFATHMPEMERAWQAWGGDGAKAYAQFTATSIDFGVMEKARNVVTFPIDCGWDDLGSWTSMEDLASRMGWTMPFGTRVAGEVVAVDSQGCIVDAKDRLVALLGVEDLIVVSSGQALLVARKDRAQDIRAIVDGVKKTRPELA
jgi:mannose-1-phosphate guanylyltransferase